MLRDTLYINKKGSLVDKNGRKYIFSICSNCGCIILTRQLGFENRNSFCSSLCSIYFRSKNAKLTYLDVFRKLSNKPSKPTKRISCAVCGKRFTVPARHRTKYCSRKCRVKVTRATTDRRNNNRFHRWSLEIKIRDNFTCYICEQRKDGQLESHHLYPWASYKELRYDLDNGVCMCKDCHKKFHKDYGRKNNTPEQIEQFKINYNQEVSQ